MIFLKIDKFGRGYKNIKRYRKITGVLAKYGFNILADKIDIKNPIRKIFHHDSNEMKKKYTRGERLRMAIEELGPSFIKLGQLLSTRHDMMPPDIINELINLQDSVGAFDLKIAKEIFKKELGVGVDEVFYEFHEKPIAAASIGQVYKGTLLSGENVVIKIQRPNITKIIEQDIDILLSLGRIIDEHFSKKTPLNAMDFINEFSFTIKKELDYTYEAQNCETFGDYFKNDSRVVIPKIYWKYTTKKVLVMEEIQGTKANNIIELEALGFNKAKLAVIGAKIFMEQILLHNFFHGDPHPGNIIILSEDIISFIDFGIVGYIDKATFEFIITVFESGYKRDIDRIIENLNVLNAITEETDLAQLKRDLYYIINYYYNVPINKINFGDAFREILITAYKDKLKLPSQLILLIKAIITIEGTGKRLNPDFNMSMISEDIIKKLTRQRLKPKEMMKEFLNFSRTSYSDIKGIPKKINQILNKLEKNQLKLQIKVEDMKQLQKEISMMSNRLSLSLIVAAIIIGSSLVIQADTGPRILGMSGIGLIGFSAAAILGIILVFSILLNWWNLKH